MPKPYLVGWKDALDWWLTQFKRSGFKFGWRRRKMLAQMIRKKYFWRTTEERVQGMKDALKALGELRSSHISDCVVDNYTRYDEGSGINGVLHGRES